MPNHVENHIEFSGDTRQIKTMLESIKNEEYGIGTIDFNKIIPMPESLHIEAGSRTDRGLNKYAAYTLGKAFLLWRSTDGACKKIRCKPI